MIRLCDLLAHCSGLHQVYLCNSGAEANEGAVKLARKWGAKHRNGAFEVVTMDHGFHGRTLAMMSASGKPQWEPLFEPKVSGFVKVPLNDIEAVAAAITPRTAAVMLEPIQGEAGVYAATDTFLRDLRALTPRHRNTADPRRDPDRHRPHRQGVRLRARRGRAGYHDSGERSRRRRAAGRAGGAPATSVVSTTATRAARSAATR